MSETQQYAYDNDTVQDCECPAVAAGYQPSNDDESRVVASCFDNAVYRLGFSNPERVLSEEDAKEAWLAAIEKLEEGGFWRERDVEVAREVADELGWEA